mmetsp:Transcript_62147/g.151598  ORF Transcript_62147/g.151598 Transcript_62147/m.151598 type:complete len:865 (+) Transcript_62147:142-2736(+)
MNFKAKYQTVEDLLANLPNLDETKKSEIRGWEAADKFPEPVEAGFDDEFSYLKYDAFLSNRMDNKRQKVSSHDPRFTTPQSKTSYETETERLPSMERREDFQTEYIERNEEDDAAVFAGPIRLLKERIDRIIEETSAAFESSQNPSRTGSETTEMEFPEPVMFWAPFLCIVQSSGYGKTRAVIELARQGHKRVVYIPCKKECTNETTWTVPGVVSEVIAEVNNKKDDADLCMRKWDKFLQAVQECTKKYDTPKTLIESQIDGEGRLGEFYREVYNEWKKKTTPTTNRVKPVVGILKSGDDTKDENPKTVTWEYTKPNLTKNSLVICFDEVTALKDVPYKALRRMAKQMNIFCLFTDTATSVCELIAYDDHSSSSNGGMLGKFAAPFYRINTLDLFWDVDRCDDDYLNLFQAGRPMWGSYVTTKQRKEVNITDEDLIGALVRYAMARLSGQGSRDLEKTEKDTLSVNFDRDPEKKRPPMNPPSEDNTLIVSPHLIAYFTCRFSMGPMSRIASLLAKYSLATLNFVSEDRTHVGTSYPSEPILAEASARLTKDRNNLKQVLDHVKASFRNTTTLLDAPKGDVGEMCTAALLGYSMDAIRYGLGHDNMSRPVPLFELLKYFKCTETLNDEIERVTSGWEISFTHFSRPNWQLTESDLKVMWKRRVAYYVQEGMQGLDLLISIKKKKEDVTMSEEKKENEGIDEAEKETFGTFRIQVKNYSGKIYKSERSSILTNLWPENCPPTIKNEAFSVGMLITTGDIDEGAFIYDRKTYRLLEPRERKRNLRSSSGGNNCEEMSEVLQLATSFASLRPESMKQCRDTLQEICAYREDKFYFHARDDHSLSALRRAAQGPLRISNDSLNGTSADT